MDKYFKAIKQNVCSICADSDEKGKCTLNKNETCAVEFYLPKIVEVIQSIDSDDINLYHSKLHDVVCLNCKANKTGNCYLREDANCSLDRYFPLIVEVVKKVDLGLIS